MIIPIDNPKIVFGIAEKIPDTIKKSQEIGLVWDDGVHFRKPDPWISGIYPDLVFIRKDIPHRFNFGGEDRINFLKIIGFNIEGIDTRYCKEDQFRAQTPNGCLILPGCIIAFYVYFTGVGWICYSDNLWAGWNPQKTVIFIDRMNWCLYGSEWISHPCFTEYKINDLHSGFSTHIQSVGFFLGWINCIDINYFVGPALLNKQLPDEKIIWPDCYYPNKQGVTDD